MKLNLKFGILLTVVVMLLTALMQAGQKEPIDWRKSYSPTLKSPYGTYVLKRELKQLFKKQPKITEVNQSLYMFLEEKANYKRMDALVFIGSNFSEGEVGTKKLLHFVKDGGTAFIAASNFDNTFLDSLRIGFRSYEAFRGGDGISAFPTYLSVKKYAKKVVFDKVDAPQLFDKLPLKNSVILGELTVNKTTAPNFIQVNYGKGAFYLHLEPDAFTNYYLLQKQTFPIAYHSLQYLEGKNILWYDGQYNIDQQTTPMRFILSNTALRIAWYLLLTALLIYLIFKSKREQRAIPVVEPETNKSVEFSKTIGSLYYENGSPGNMVLKKIHYFLFDIRRNYHLDTNELSDAQFIYSLSQRTHLSEGEVRSFFEEISAAQKRTEFSMADLKHFYHLIEDFKEKVGMN